MVKSLIRFLVGTVAWLLTSFNPALAQDARTFVPAGAQVHAPVLVQTQREVWPHAPEPWTLAGLIEQESCLSLKHSKCWNPRAELKTSREYGFGFGQVTVAYNPDGSERFNKFDELRAAHASLRGWTWAERYDPGYQLRAIVEMNLDLWRRVAVAPGATVTDQWAFVLSSYNGGLGSVLQDRRLCSNTRGCDPARWFGHVEETSLKSRVPQREYGGQSWYSINRSHVHNVIKVRRDKYRPFWEA